MAKFQISFDGSNALAGIRKLRSSFDRAIHESIKETARLVLKDSRPFIPLLTGRLRDSGRVEELERYTFKLIWDAANPKSNFIYAEVQYKKVLNHIDGRYAAKWVEKTFNSNRQFYVNFMFQSLQNKLENLLGQ